MKIRTLILVVLAAALHPLMAADPTPNDDIAGAAKRLADKPNYSWKLTTVVPESMPFKPGPTEGKTEKDGFSQVTLSFGDNLTEVVLKGDNGVIANQEGEWKTRAELANAEGRERFQAAMLRGVKIPAPHIKELLEGVKELKKEGNVYSGDLSAEGVKKQFTFGEPKNPKGSVKFWLKDGDVFKYEVKVSATMEFNGNGFDASRTMTTELKDVGSTKVSAPEAARKKL